MTRLEVGRLAKAHGLRGEISVVLTTDLTEERTRKGSILFAAERALTVISSRAHQDRFIVKFDGVDSREDADALRGVVLTADSIEGEGMVFAHDVIGCNLIDQHGTDHGQVISLVDNPASELMELESGALVPMVFYVSHAGGVVHVDVPAGLLGDADEN